MKKFLSGLCLLIGGVGCAPLSQQQATFSPKFPAEELSIIQDEKLFNEARYVIENGIYEWPEKPEAWTGPCIENPLFNSRFQSGYTIVSNDLFKIVNHKLILNISHGGGCGCSQKMMIWDGKLTRDDQGNQVAQFVFSFKNWDSCRAITYTTLMFDLKSINFGTAQEVVIRVNRLPESETYRPFEN